MFNDDQDSLVPIKESNVQKPLKMILNQLASKNNVNINNLKVKEFYNRVSNEYVDTKNTNHNYDENFQEIFRKNYSKMLTRIEQNKIISEVSKNVTDE